MKNFILCLIILVIGAGAIAAVYPAISPYHARLRAQISDPAKREAAIHTAIDFETTKASFFAKPNIVHSPTRDASVALSLK